METKVIFLNAAQAEPAGPVRVPPMPARQGRLVSTAALVLILTVRFASRSEQAS